MIAITLAAAVTFLVGCVSGPLESQAIPWDPPKTTLSKGFVDAAKFLLAHGLGDHNLQNQVNAAAQVKAQMNPVGQALHQSLAAKA